MKTQTCDICGGEYSMCIGEEKQHGLCSKHWDSWVQYKQRIKQTIDLDTYEKVEQYFAEFIKEQK